MRNHVSTAMLLWPMLHAVGLQAEPNQRLASLIDHWEGAAYQFDANITFKISLRCDGEAIRVGYPDLGCDGSWKLVEGKGGRLALLEKIHYDPNDDCTDNGYVKLEYAGEGRWFVSFYHPAKDDLQAVGGLRLVTDGFPREDEHEGKAYLFSESLPGGAEVY